MDAITVIRFSVPLIEIACVVLANWRPNTCRLARLASRHMRIPSPLQIEICH